MWWFGNKGAHILFLAIIGAEYIFNEINLELVEKKTQELKEAKKIDWFKINKQSS